MPKEAPWYCQWYQPGSLVVTYQFPVLLSFFSPILVYSGAILRMNFFTFQLILSTMSGVCIGPGLFLKTSFCHEIFNFFVIWLWATLTIPFLFQAVYFTFYLNVSETLVTIDFCGTDSYWPVSLCVPVFILFLWGLSVEVAKLKRYACI